jgi:hypothetical protein
MRCATCDKSRTELLKTAYGDYICEDCWDEYICSDAGKLEYLIGICREDYPASDFDAEFLGEAAKSFLENKNLLDLTSMELTEIALKAHELGLL